MVGVGSPACAPLAQWIARWTSNPKVAGSTPARGTHRCVVMVSMEGFHPSDPGSNPGIGISACISVVEYDPSKVETRVRFPTSARRFGWSFKTPMVLL